MNEADDDEHGDGLNIQLMRCNNFGDTKMPSKMKGSHSAASDEVEVKPKWMMNDSERGMKIYC